MHDAEHKHSSKNRMAFIGKIDERIGVDPSLLEADVHVDDIPSSEDHDFAHDADWVTKVCDQIRLHRFALIRLPLRYAKVYHNLLHLKHYSSLVTDPGMALEIRESAVTNVQFLPMELLELCEIWASVGECVCRPIARKLLALTSSFMPSTSDSHDQVHGEVRLSYDSSNGPHFDNSYVTLIGTGSVKGSLQFSVLKGGVDDREDFEPCESFFDCSNSKVVEQSTFMLVNGACIGSMHWKEYKPLLHRVVRGSGTARTNAIYFLRRFSTGDRKLSTTELNLFAFNQDVVRHQAFLNKSSCTVLHPCSELANGCDNGAANGTDVGEEAAEPSSDTEIDWSGDGLMTLEA